jgi:hypothetical protein
MKKINESRLVKLLSLTISAEPPNIALVVDESINFGWNNEIMIWTEGNSLKWPKCAHRDSLTHEASSRWNLTENSMGFAVKE